MAGEEHLFGVFGGESSGRRQLLRGEVVAGIQSSPAQLEISAVSTPIRGAASSAMCDH